MPKLTIQIPASDEDVADATSIGLFNDDAYEIGRYMQEHNVPAYVAPHETRIYTLGGSENIAPANILAEIIILHMKNVGLNAELKNDRDNTAAKIEASGNLTAEISIINEVLHNLEQLKNGDQTLENILATSFRDRNETGNIPNTTKLHALYQALNKEMKKDGNLKFEVINQPPDAPRQRGDTDFRIV
jgi:hypothetical protein